MKKIFVFLFLIVLAFACSGQVNEIHYLDTATLEWDDITTDEEGTPFPVEFIVSYDVYVYNSSLSIEDQVPDNLTFMGNASQSEAVLDLSGFPFALYYAGVRVVVDNGQGEITTSLIAWSYDPAVVSTIPFGYLHLEGSLFLPLPSGLRDSGI